MSADPQKPDKNASTPDKSAAPATTAAIGAAAGSGNLLRQLQDRLVYLERRVAQQEQIIQHQKDQPGTPLQAKPLPPKGPTMADLHRQAQALHAAVAEREKQLQDQAQLIARVRQEREQVVLTFQQLRRQAEALQRAHREKLQELQQTQAEREALAKQLEEAGCQLENVRKRVDELEQELEWTRGQIPPETPMAEVLSESIVPELEDESSWPIDTEDEPEPAALPASAPEAASAQPQPVDRPMALTARKPSRWVAGIIILAGLVLAGANLATWVSPEKTYVSGGVVTGDADLVTEWAGSAPTAWRTRTEPGGRLVLYTLSEHPEEARRELESWIDGLIQRTMMDRETVLDEAPQTEQKVEEARVRAEKGRDDLQSEIRSLEQRLASLGTLRSRRVERQAALHRVQAQLNALEEPAEINPAQIVIPEEEIQKAERRDERLQADLTAWTRQSERLKTEALTGLQAHQEDLEIMVQTAAKSADTLKELLASDVSEVAREDVEALRKLAEALSAAATSFKEQYSDTRARLSAIDPESILSVLDPDWFEALAAFEGMASGRLSKMVETVEAIGRAGEDPTQRLVLQNRLSQELKPLQEAWAAVSGGLRDLMPSQNRALKGLLESVRNVRPRIVNRRKEIVAELRNRELDRQRLVVHQKRTEIEKKRADLLEEERRILKELNDLSEQLTDAYLSLRDSTGKLRQAGRRLFDELQALPATRPAETPTDEVRMSQVRPLPIRFSASGPGTTGQHWSEILRWINVGGSLVILLMIIVRFGGNKRKGSNQRN